MKITKNTTQKLSKTKSHPFWSWFWLTFLIVSVSYAFYSFYTPSNDVKWSRGISSTQALSKDSGKNKLLFFTGKWCSPCRIMKREIFADQNIAKIINTELVAIEIDIDDPNTKEIVKRYNVSATPTTIILDSQGKTLDYAIGRIEKKKFIEMLNSTDSN